MHGQGRAERFTGEVCLLMQHQMTHSLHSLAANQPYRLGLFLLDPRPVSLTVPKLTPPGAGPILV